MSHRNINNRRVYPAAAVALALGAAASLPAQASVWSDTSLGYRYGTSFHEPYIPDKIAKNIYSLTHVSGYAYGTNFFNVDLLDSDSKDPAANTPEGAQEAYVVYRNVLDLGKLGHDIKFAGVRGVGITFGFDWNTKNDAGYASKKRMLLLGPTLMFDVPGYAKASVVVLHESNASVSFPPYQGCSCRKTYDVHAGIIADWGIPLGKSFDYEGYLNVIAPKGKDESGRNTGAEINWDSQVMWDLSSAWAGPPKMFRLGIEYQFWKNKFGVTATGNPYYGYVPGTLASTPMVRIEYHF